MHNSMLQAGELSRATQCRACGAKIYFIRLQSGKSMPVDAGSMTTVAKAAGGTPYVTIDGGVIKAVAVPHGDIVAYTSHFATCPFADQLRRSR